MEIIFVRHTTPDVPPGTCYGWSDVDVATSFTIEASLTKENLKLYLPVEKAFTSPLKRAVKLAEFCGFKDAERDDRLKEMNMGDWEMQLYDEIKDPALEAWLLSAREFRRPNKPRKRDLLRKYGQDRN